MINWRLPYYHVNYILSMTNTPLIFVSSSSLTCGRKVSSLRQSQFALSRFNTRV